MSVKDIDQIIEDRVQYIRERSKEFLGDLDLIDQTVIHGGL